MDDIIRQSQEYSLNIGSDLYHQLPEHLRHLWKQDVEYAFVNGANALQRSIDMLFDDVQQRTEDVIEMGMSAISCHLNELAHAKTGKDVIEQIKTSLHILGDLCLALSPTEFDKE